MVHFWQQIRLVFSFNWENPMFLYLLILPILWLFIKYGLRKNKRAKIVLVIPNDFPENKLARLQKYIPDVLQSLLIVSLVIALAEPYTTIKYAEYRAEGINFAIGIDISSSMKNRDVAPSRFDVAKNMAQDFMKKRIAYDAFSLIAFAGEPNLISPLTQDKNYLFPSLQKLHAGLINEEGTALGDAMGTCINQLRDSDNPKKIAIIISDGNNTAGNLDPGISSKLAKIFHIKFYTIAVGTEGNQLDPVDENTLRNIASLTHGTFFRANDSQAMASIFKEIDQLEKTKIKINKWEEHKNQSLTFLIIALILFIINLALKLTWIGNILED